MKRMAFLIVCALVLATAAAAQELTPIQQLGKNLFFDNISQPRRGMDCAFCHAPSAGWVGDVAGLNVRGSVYPGADPVRFGNRKPPSAAYSTYAPIFRYDGELGEFVGGVFWDGRATGERLGSPAAEQALGPWLNPVEQNMPGKQAVCEVVSQSRYAGLFEQVWGPDSLDCTPAGVDLTYDRFGLSIAEYEGSTEVSPFNSRFDDFWTACLAAGNDPEACGSAEGFKEDLDPANILSDLEWDGLIEFGEYCSACHTSTEPGPSGTPPLFTNFTFANLGLPKNPDNPFYEMDEVYLDDGTPINPQGADWIDLGLGEFLAGRTEWEAMAAHNVGKFRVPTLRNVAKGAGPGVPKAYMHNGVLKSLEDVVHFYNTRDVAAEGWPAPEVPTNVTHMLLEGKPLGNLELDAHAERAIVAFLQTLSDRKERGARPHVTLDDEQLAERQHRVLGARSEVVTIAPKN